MSFFMNDRTCIYSQDSAKDYLEKVGITLDDFIELSKMLNEDTIDQLTYENECLQHEFKSYEADLESKNSLLNEIQNMCDEALAMKRISKSRERFTAISKMINNEI